ncbi:2-hydroxyacid dehydrogenase [Pseudomonas sp. CFBP 13727]|uniref:2-hydroxyacid dehydrogenase n=1 Tax=Pseudomonas sp. CFBP 13727 TaxID=2775295 RepID=UPI00178767C2|nr:glyoxylate/hydroxypyruvate reductase A [Pseudomonas sp. CFBP 13727]MBD8623920.1 glyoxylate/hydroxypyruvate reductase A [Pseudomonas sp. CFBP 13727]
MTLLFKVPDERASAWKALFAQHAPDIPVRFWPDIGDPAQVRYFAAWQPPADLYDRFPQLQVVFATSAGVDQFDLAHVPEAVSVVRMLDPGIAQGIIEYAGFAVLALHRQMPTYLQQQREGKWAIHPLLEAGKRRVGVMGLGNLGQAALNALRPFGFALSGWSRTLKTLPGVQCHGGREQLPDFLGSCDILLCLLPLTADTAGILDAQTFAALPAGASLINLGRGGHLVEADLLAALDSGHLGHAIVDVLEEEPPRSDHPFLSHPNIWLTPHIGAMTDPHSAFQVLLDNIRRHQRGEPMAGLVEPGTGY